MSTVVEVVSGAEISAELVASVRKVLSGGEVVAIPTDTVYGLAIDPSVSGAAEKVFRAKGRPQGVQLPVLCGNEEQARSVASSWEGPAAALAERFWPGPLTLVVRRASNFGVSLGDLSQTVGLRVPAHDLVHALCHEGPLATTSANHHGQPPAQSAEQVVAILGESVALVVDGGPCDGTVSTVVDCAGRIPMLLRQGAISRTDIEKALGREIALG